MRLSPLRFFARRAVSSSLAVSLGVSLPWVAGVSGVGGVTTASAAPASGASGGGSLSAAMGALGGAVDERTGEARFAPSLGSVSGPADSGLAVNAQFSQLLSAAGVDRYGLGAGMSLGLPFVDVERGVLVLASGEHRMDASAETGLKDYKLKDVSLKAVSATAPVPHAYTLESLKDGSKQYFDGVGDLVGVRDRFGHVTKLTWKLINNKHRLESVTGGWGSRLSVTYEGSKVTFTSPRRWGQAKAPQTVVERSQGRIKSVTDAAGQRTGVEWTVKGTNAVVVPAAVVAPTGARTEFTYGESEARSGGVVAVSKVEVRNSANRVLLDPVTVSLNPDGANGGRNYTGCPQYCADGTDRLENSGDGSFTYRVRFSQTNGQEVERAYNALHLLKSEVARVRVGSQTKEVSRTEFSYPGETPDGAPPTAMKAPVNYQLPTEVRATTIDPNDPSRTRVTEASSRFDALGRLVGSVQGGLETTTEFGQHSIPVRTETRDTATGARQVVENSLTGDGKAIAKSVTRAAAKGTDELRTVSAQQFEYHTGELAGEVSKVTATGDSTARGGDPGAAVTSTRSTLDKDADGVGRRTDTVTGTDGVTTVTVSDLANGATLSEKVGDLGEASAEYDVADRPTKSTGLDGAVTTVTYAMGSGGGSTTSRRASDGLASRTTTDELGRNVLAESNYKPSGNGGKGAILSEGQWLRVVAAEFDTSGRQVRSIDGAGRVTRTEYDAWGLPSQVTGPNGSRTVSSHDGVAGTTTRQLVPAGRAGASVTSTETVDDRGNPVRSETRFGDGSAGVVSESSFDAFGRPVSSDHSTSAFTADHAYTPAGPSESDSLSPRRAGVGQSAKAEYLRDAFGNKTRKTLTSQGGSTSGFTTKFDAAGRPAQVSLPGEDATFSMAHNPVNGLAESMTRSDGSVAHRRSDGAGRAVEAWTSPKGDPGAKDGHVRTAYDPVTGKPAEQWVVGDEAGSRIAYAYYPDGKLRERTDPGGKKTAFTYTDDGEIATATDQSGAVAAYTYDATTGLISGAVQTRDGKELARVSYTHDTSGRLVRADRGNGATSTYTYNDVGLPTGEKHTGPGGEVIAEHAYTYTSDRKLLTGIATVGGKRTATAHTYDAEGRLSLTHVTEGDRPGQGTLVGRTAYAHDLASNVTEQQTTTRAPDGTEKTTTTRYTHDPKTSRTTAVTVDGQEKRQTYDTAGRLTEAADGTRHTYNTTGQLVETRAPDGTTVTNAYNAAGERATQTTRTPDGRANTLTFHPGTETDQNGATATYLTGATRESRTVTPADGQNPQTGYYLTNRHGDKTHTLGANGTETSRSAYTDHGRPLTPAARTGAITENPYGYAGEYTTPTGHQPLGTRWYDPKAAAFTGPDTPAAGMLNAYAYATGDPVNFTDPTGRSPKDAWDWSQVGIDFLFLGLNVAALALGPTPYGLVLKAGAVAGGLALGLDTLTILNKYFGFLPEEARKPFEYAGYALTAVDVIGGIYGGALLAGKAASKFTMPPMAEGQGSAFGGNLEGLAKGISKKCKKDGYGCAAPAGFIADVLNGKSPGLDWSQAEGRLVVRSSFEKGMGRKFSGPYTRSQLTTHLAGQQPGTHGVVLGAFSSRRNFLTKGLTRIANFFDTNGEVGHYFNVVRLADGSAAVDGFTGKVLDLSVKVESSNYANRFYYMDMGEVAGGVTANRGWSPTVANIGDTPPPLTEWVVPDFPENWVPF
ncbi:tRNA nuclease WapA precursor [Streptomyces sp. ADI96-02]|uniref:RHS repeat domain-containing protein n=1 Tax=unclassified Streptomyces TaxID=2593676 RepID=UPI000F55203D|nr:RHS repeat-associated core domain-containing protein [Streptomyces sp. ADI96-02]RPK55059.1 tRNA nuclease WapA precursor [Streptomyces sp. ADI96-02]